MSYLAESTATTTTTTTASNAIIFAHTTCVCASLIFAGDQHPGDVDASSSRPALTLAYNDDYNHDCNHNQSGRPVFGQTGRLDFMINANADIDRRKARQARFLDFNVIASSQADIKLSVCLAVTIQLICKQ